ncbi:TetR/AcrR family transcriptional regulator [Streptomyces uncialis]|uniref:TetR/AcrR family transcriptional regulator n=1 Tax=Streptomyces uncialis TaxID=1048205 RepID=UPI001FEBF1F4|nr:TetR/AcrR family transcriptional regulator [Streptomyces uncialis]
MPQELKGRVDELTQEPVIVWLRPGRGARGPAAGVSHAELAAAAVGVADRSGLGAVSMRQVAKELGVGQSSLYRYVSSREDLLDLMTDAAAGETDLGVPLRGDPVEDLLELALRTRAVQLRHPWLTDIPPEPLRLGPCGLAYLEYALRAMENVRLPGPAKLEALAVMNALIAQFVRTEAGNTPASSGRRAAQAAYLNGAAAQGNHPRLAAALAERVEGQGVTEAGTTEDDPHGRFRRTMRRVLDALVTPGIPA